ncbi:MAG TPA: LOG family protein [Alphaproteobacteria bacterium]
MTTRRRTAPRKPVPVTHPPLAFLDQDFLMSQEARTLRILAEYLEPAKRFEEHDVKDTVVFFGSARIKPRDEAERMLAEARAARHRVAVARQQVRMSRFYEETRELARRLTEWSKGLPGGKRFVVCTGGGPGIMEAANRGASEARGINIGLNIALPFEQAANPYSTHSLTFQFHYFFMRKFWFAYFAKAMVFMPGGFGTLDELAECLTLCQTFKLKKRMPMVLYGTDFWRKALDFNALVEAGTVSRGDLDLIYRTDTVDDAFDFVTGALTGKAIEETGGTLEHATGVLGGVVRAL